MLPETRALSVVVRTNKPNLTVEEIERHFTKWHAACVPHGETPSEYYVDLDDFAFEGEDAWLYTERAYVHAPSGGWTSAISDEPNVLDEVRRRFERLAPAFQRLRPSEVRESPHDGLTPVQRFAHEHRNQARPPLVWIQAEGEDDWGTALRLFNIRRDLIGREGPVHVVLAGSPQLAATLRDYPDLLSALVRHLGLNPSKSYDVGACRLDRRCNGWICDYNKLWQPVSLNCRTWAR